LVRPFLFFVVLGALASAQSREVHYPAALTPLNTVPTFDRGYIAVYDHVPGTNAYLISIDLYSPQGRLMYTASAHPPNGGEVSIHNVAVDDDGTLAAAVGDSTSCKAPVRGSVPSAASGIALFDPSGIQTSFIDTGCGYLTSQVAFGPDHSIWTLGYLPLPQQRASVEAYFTANYLTLRHYAQDGRELGAFLPRASLPHPDDPKMEPVILPQVGLWQLRVVNEQVEILLPRVSLWVETGLDGREAGRWSTGEASRARPTAFTADGRAWRQDGEQLMVFDRAVGAWTRAASQDLHALLIGGDGNNLVFLMPDRGTVRWMWAPTKALVMTQR
jgi:hypothetical protein